MRATSCHRQSDRVSPLPKSVRPRGVSISVCYVIFRRCQNNNKKNIRSNPSMWMHFSMHLWHHAKAVWKSVGHKFGKEKKEDANGTVVIQYQCKTPFKRKHISAFYMFFTKSAKMQSKITKSSINIYIYLDIPTVYMEAVKSISFSRMSKLAAVAFFLFFDS